MRLRRLLRAHKSQDVAFSKKIDMPAFFFLCFLAFRGVFRRGLQMIYRAAKGKVEKLLVLPLCRAYHDAQCWFSDTRAEEKGTTD